MFRGSAHSPAASKKEPLGPSEVELKRLKADEPPGVHVTVFRPSGCPNIACTRKPSLRHEDSKPSSNPQSSPARNFSRAAWGALTRASTSASPPRSRTVVRRPRLPRKRTARLRTRPTPPLGVTSKSSTPSIARLTTRASASVACIRSNPNQARLPIDAQPKSPPVRQPASSRMSPLASTGRPAPATESTGNRIRRACKGPVHSGRIPHDSSLLQSPTSVLQERRVPAFASQSEAAPCSSNNPDAPRASDCKNAGTKTAPTARQVKATELSSKRFSKVTPLSVPSRIKPNCKLRLQSSNDHGARRAASSPPWLDRNLGRGLALAKRTGLQEPSPLAPESVGPPVGDVS